MGKPKIRVPSGKNGHPNARPNQEKLKGLHLSKIYYNASHPASYGGLDKLYKAVKNKFTRKQVKEWLAKQEAYTLHKPAQRKFKRNKIYVGNIADQFQSDLNDMRYTAKNNDGYQYILTCIDCFSRYAWAVPLKNKTPQSVKEGFVKIFKESKPSKLQTDKGKEFLGSVFQTFLKTEGVTFFTTENSDSKAVMVERLNRTLKTRMARFFERNNTRRYIEALPKLLHSYNHTVHKSIKMAPADVNDLNIGEVWKTLYGKPEVLRDPKFNLGDRVRISRTKERFEKGYEANFSREIFKITKIRKALHPVYEIKDMQDEPIKGTFYESELQKVSEPDTYKVEKVLSQRKVKGKTQYFVKWLGYPSSFNSWVNDVVLPNLTE